MRVNIPTIPSIPDSLGINASANLLGDRGSTSTDSGISENVLTYLGVPLTYLGEYLTYTE